MKPLAGITCTIVLTACAVLLLASPPIDVTPALIGRATYKPFTVKATAKATDHDPGRGGPHALLDFEAKAKTHLDMVVQTHDYLPWASTGWHTHPGPIFITVTEGTLTFYEVDDPNCSPKVVRAGEGYVDTGHGHIGRNESGLPAKDVTVAIAPVGSAFRSELPEPGPYCAF
jgi:quercetin dioxygenase-like cupin family protein